MTLQFDLSPQILKVRTLKPLGKAPEVLLVTALAIITSKGASTVRQNTPEPKAQIRPLLKQMNPEHVSRTPPKVRSLKLSAKAPEASTLTAPVSSSC